MTDQICKNCTYWRRPKGLNIQATMGECHRYAMSAHLVPAKDGLGNVQVQTVGVWPPAPADEWCGEWASTGGLARRPSPSEPQYPEPH